MDFSIELPLDSDGFLRRQCPSCGNEFKWHFGPANEEAERHADLDEYHCPLCGQVGATDRWNTAAQTEYAQGIAMKKVAELADAELDGVFRKMSNGSVRLEKVGDIEAGEAPAPLVELDDMTIVCSPCHDYEPIKVPDGTSEPIYCLLCGRAFAV